MERLMDQVHTLLSGRKFESIDEMNAFLQEQLKDGPLKPSRRAQAGSTDPRRRAQELCWDAMDAPTEAAARRLYKQALALDPDCTSALVFKAGEAKLPGQAIAILERAVGTAAERLGGAAFFSKNRGHFWMIQDTRPYMLAKAALADACAEDGRMFDCVSHYEEMLELCPNDNQGVRYQLLGRYLRMGEQHRAALLLEKYKNEISTIFLYARVLLLVMSQNEAKAGKLLKHARAANPYVFEYLTGRSENPPRAEAVYSAGDESEAAFCLECLHEAYLYNPVAVMWMMEQGGRGSRRGPSLVE